MSNHVHIIVIPASTERETTQSRNPNLTSHEVLGRETGTEGEAGTSAWAEASWALVSPSRYL
jgi:hypothetical protein